MYGCPLNTILSYLIHFRLEAPILKLSPYLIINCVLILVTGQTATVMRGTWFVDGTWQPLDEGYANQIETEHLAKFESQKIPEDIVDGGKVPLQGKGKQDTKLDGFTTNTSRILHQTGYK